MTTSTHTPARAPHPATPQERREPGEVFGSGFTLFADMLLIGLLTTLACLPVVTVPAALAAASATLRESAHTGVQASTATFRDRLREGLTGRGLALGLLPPALAFVLLLDHAIARTALPGAGLVSPALTLLTLGAVVVGLRATALAPPHRLSGREALARATADPRGTLLLACGVLLAALLVWALPLLLPLLPGPLALAATAVDLRRPAAREDG